MGGWQTGGQGLIFYGCFRTPSKGLKHKHMQEKEQTWPLTKLWLGVLWLQGVLWRTPVWLICLRFIWESIRPGASGSKKVHPCAVGDGHRLSETQKVCNAENLQRRKSAMQKIRRPMSHGPWRLERFIGYIPIPKGRGLPLP